MEENKDMMAPAEETSVPETTPEKANTENTPAKETAKKTEKSTAKKRKKMPSPPPEPEENGEDAPKMSKSKRILNTVINVVLIIAIVIAAMSTYISFMSTSGSGAPSFFGYSIMTIESKSMEPIINEGDLIVGKAVPNNIEKRHEFARELRPGDIITYRTFINGEPALNTHAIYNVYDLGENLEFETKGENNDYVDPMRVHESSLEAKYLFRIPSLGNVVEYIQSPVGFFLVVVVPALIFFIFHLVQFFKVLFEYQNVKMLIKYEQERGRTEDLIESQIKDQETREELRRAAMEAELREKIRKEMMAEQEKADSAKADEPAEDKTEQ